MGPDSKLRFQAIIDQSVAAREILKQDNESLSIVETGIDQFVANNELTSDSFGNLKQHMQDYKMLISTMRKANDSDIDDFAFLAFVIHKLPLRWFDHRKKCFHIFKWERKFYEKIKIKKWKDHIPELGTLANFRKNKVLEPNNNIYVQKFLTECCYGEMIHFLSIIFGILIIFIAPKYFLLLGFPVVVANALINYLSFAILRYTRPKLLQLYKRNCRKEKTNL